MDLKLILITCGYELVTHGFELVIRRFKIVTRRFELVTHGFELVTRISLVTRYPFPLEHVPFLKNWIKEKCFVYIM